MLCLFTLSQGNTHSKSVDRDEPQAASSCASLNMNWQHHGNIMGYHGTTWRAPGFMLPAALTRLMRKLRGLGLDTAILREGAPQRELVETAENEDRSSNRKIVQAKMYEYTTYHIRIYIICVGMCVCTGHSLSLYVFLICQSIIVSIYAFVQKSYDLNLDCSMKSIC